jgi:hypothetical protein
MQMYEKLQVQLFPIGTVPQLPTIYLSVLKVDGTVHNAKSGIDLYSLTYTSIFSRL